MLDVARDRRKILKKEKEKNEKKSNNNKYFFTFAFLYGKTYENRFGKAKFILLHICIGVLSHGRLLEMCNKTPTPQCIGVIDAALRPKILANRLGILT